MSILNPKDGDYIVRGIFLLLGWTLAGWVPFAVLGGILAGTGGATIGLLAGVLFGPFILYPSYLKLDPKVYPKKAKDCICGHTRADHKYGLACHDLYCDTCYHYKPRPWWRSKASYDPHNWSV